MEQALARGQPGRADAPWHEPSLVSPVKMSKKVFPSKKAEFITPKERKITLNFDVLCSGMDVTLLAKILADCTSEVRS